MLLLCAAMGRATAIFNGNGQGTASSPYEIWNLDRLNEVRNFVGNEGAGVYFRLEKDLDLTEYLEGLSWDAIGTSTEPFKGVFLGNNKKITGMTINGSADYQGFFGYISGATIQDLTIEGTVSGAGHVGGIVGGSTGTNTIKNCTFNGNVTGSGSYIGGIAGDFAGTLKNVTHTGTTTGAGYVGGIAGQQTSGSMTTATNSGDIMATTSYCAGGIVGYCTIAISSAYNVGSVTGKQYTGGLIGYSSGTVTGCSAKGNVSGSNYTGGLIGQSNGATVTGCSAKGNVSGSNYTGGLIGQSSASITNGRHSDGNVSGTNYVGGLIGKLSVGSVTSSYTYADITGTDNVGGIVGYYELGFGSHMQINSSGYFGNISARQYVGGILGQLVYNGGGEEITGYPEITLNKYKVYGASTSSDKTYEETLTEYNQPSTIANCAAVGDVIGTGAYVGGILGKGCGGNYLSKQSYSFKSSNYTSNHYQSSIYYYYKFENDFWTSKYSATQTSITYYNYKYFEASTSLTDNYFSGNLKGTDYVGGLAGYMHGGTISRNHSYAAIEGSNKVGGIVGYMQADLNNITTTISCNVALNSTVTATSKAGKVYGYTTGSYLTIATSGSTINKTLNTTSLIIGGVTQETSNDAQNGTLQTQRMLLQSTAYSGLGWNFNSGAEWTSEESVSYPYKQWQTAPPTIKSGAVKGSTTLSGTCTDDGTVYVTIEGNSTVYEATCSSGNWSLTVPTLRSGILLRAWSKNADKEQSYQTATSVSFPGSGTEADPWQVYDAYDLQGVNKDGYYKQMNDIDLTSWIAANSSTKGWVPVGYSGNNPIIYNGDSHKVTGLWTSTTDNFVGLFSNFSKGEIRNLTVNATSKQVKGGHYVGIVIGRIGEGTIENVTANGNISAGSMVGGIAGYTDKTTLNQLTYTGQLTATGWVGGITSHANSASFTECEAKDIVIKASASPYVGGLVAFPIVAINNCKVTGTITLSGTHEKAYVGGLAGLSNNTISKCSTDVTISSASVNGIAAGIVAVAYSSATIKQSTSAGSITCTGANSYTGGIVGENTGAVVENCYSTADVTGTGYVGGIVGYTKGSIKNSYATGSLLNSSDDGRAGGIAGFIEGSAAIIKGCGGLNKRIETGSNQWGFRIIGGTGNDISRPEETDNYGWNEMPILRNNATKTVYDDPYEGTAKTTGQLQQQSTYEALNWDFTDVWTMTSGGFPQLQWLADTQIAKGDLNDDGTVTITDVVMIVDVIAGTITQANKLAAADVNGDGEVTITDCVAAIDLIAAQQTGAASRAARGTDYTSADAIDATLSHGKLAVSLDNVRSYTAFQMVVTMPEGMTLGKASIDKTRGEYHQAVVRNLGNGQYLVAGFSMDNDVLAGNSGYLLSIDTDGQATGDIVISNIEFATTDAEGYQLADAVAGCTTGISQIANGKSANSECYDLQGRRVETPTKGLYILNGKKVNMK